MAGFAIDLFIVTWSSAEPTNVVGKDKILPSPLVSDRLTVMGICRCDNSQNLLRIETSIAETSRFVYKWDKHTGLGKCGNSQNLLRIET